MLHCQNKTLKVTRATFYKLLHESFWLQMPIQLAIPIKAPFLFHTFYVPNLALAWAQHSLKLSTQTSIPSFASLH